MQISDHRDSVCHTGFHSAKRFSYKLDSSGIIRCPDSVLCDFDFFIPIFAVFSTIFLNVQFEEELLNGGTGLIIHKGSIKKQVPNPPGSGKDIAEGKGAYRKMGSEGSRMWGTY